jgi:hypothetical protein
MKKRINYEITCSGLIPFHNPDLLLLLLVHLQHPFRQEGEQVVHHVRFFLVGDEVASLVLGQAGLYLGQDFSEFALGVELLAGRGGRCFGAWLAEYTIRRNRWPRNWLGF